MKRTIGLIAIMLIMLAALSADAIYRGPRGGLAGIAVGRENGDVVAARVMSGSGADRAGIVDGDVIIAIDGMAVKGKSLSDVEKMLVGGVGSDVAISIRNNDGTPRVVHVIRQELMGTATAGIPISMNLPKPHDLRPEDGAVCRIASISGRTALLDCGENAGVDPRQVVRFVHREDYASSNKIATGRVTKVMETSSLARINGSAKAIDPDRDIAVTSAWRSERARENTLWRVTARGINLLDYPTGLPYATIDQLRFDTEMKVEKAAVTKMSQRLQEAADMAHKIYRGRISKGTFRGKKLADAFKDTTPQDVMAFLQFLNTYPDKYVGRDWSLPQVYATWVISGTP